MNVISRDVFGQIPRTVWFRLIRFKALPLNGHPLGPSFPSMQAPRSGTGVPLAQSLQSWNLSGAEAGNRDLFQCTKLALSLSHLNLTRSHRWRKHFHSPIAAPGHARVRDLPKPRNPAGRMGIIARKSTMKSPLIRYYVAIATT